MFHARLRADLELRLLEERHAPVLFALIDQDRHYLREWFAWVDATETEDDILNFIRGSRERFAAKNDITTGIWFQNQFAGTLSTHRTDMLNRRTELGYWLGKQFQGQGIMTEACRALVAHALGEMELNRVEIRCSRSNLRSQAIPKRLGFTHEATLREAELLQGKYHDLQIWSMLRRELRA